MSDGQPQDTGAPAQETPAFTFEGDGTLVFKDGRKYVPFERYSGLQGPLSKKEQENQSLRAQIHQLSEQRETEISQLKAELDTFQKGNTDFQSQIEALTQAKTELEAQLQGLGRTVETHKLLMTEKYAPLIPSLEKGTLRLEGLEGEELTKYLDTFLEDRMQFAEQFKSQQRQGDSPPPPAAGSRADLTLEEISDQLISMPINDPNRDAMMTQYNQMLAQLDSQPNNR